MKRIFPEYTYGRGPRDRCWWDDTCEMPAFEPLRGALRCDVAVIGAGFTGVSAALHLARAGASVAVFDAVRIGWGASGRNGGFCCLGGGTASDHVLDRRFGRIGRLEWRQTECAAVTLVETLVTELDLDVDRHSHGETLLAHTAREAAGFEVEARRIEENYGVSARIDRTQDIGVGWSFHAALTVPIGFALNPRKLLAGLVRAARAAGVQFFEKSPASFGAHKTLQTPRGAVEADSIIVATNGYSSEDVPRWMAGRYLPTQSNVLVTRPLSAEEQAAQGWTSTQMAYDTRHLLHYFRLMPDGRFLFGMRGGLLSGPRSERRARAMIRRDFCNMFPAWANVDITHSWSGLVCLARNRLPFVGAVPGRPGVFTGFAFHGNGVAMGTYVGACLADLVSGQKNILLPAAMCELARKIPFGRARRALLPPIYLSFAAKDRFP